MKFNKIVKEYDSELKIKTDKFLKTWDGLSPSNSLFESIVLLTTKNENEILKKLISKNNIFELYKIEKKIDDLLFRMKTNYGKRQYIPILLCGGGKQNIIINNENYNKINDIKNKIQYKENKITFSR